MVVVDSLRPWFVVHVSSGVDQTLYFRSQNAWQGSPLWLAAAVAATLLWFGVARGLTQWTRRLVAAGLLVGAVGLVGLEWRGVHGPTVEIATISHNPAPSHTSVDGRYLYSAELQSAHYLAFATLLGMSLVAATPVAAAQTRRR